MSARPAIPDIAAVIAAELAALAADAKTLAARLSPGDVVAAVVLPSNGLTDLLDIGGLRVAAELPSTLLPGQTITVQVVEFIDDRINLQVIATQAPPESAVRSRGAQRRAEPAVAARAAARPLPPNPAPASPVSPAPGAPAHKTIEARLAASHAMAPGGTRPAAAAPAAVRPLIAMRPPSAPALGPPAFAAPRDPAGFADPAALLRALRLPVTATNVTMARMALDQPERLPNALAVLERAVANSADPRVATLSTLATFLARLEPGSPVLATRIGAFVDQIVTGREAKIGRLAANAAAQSAAEAGGIASACAALDHDLKSQLFALAGEPGSGEPPPGSATLSDAVAGALTAITAVQLKASGLLAAHPDGFAFAIPVTLADGVVEARVRIGREFSNGAREPFEADRPRISFELETRRLGTVVLELSGTARMVTLEIIVEDAAARSRIDAELGALTARLEKLDYRVQSARASIKPQPAAAGAVRGARVADSMRHVDVDA